MASLAMLPIVLAASAQLEMMPSDEGVLREAINAWHLTGPGGGDPSDAVEKWWRTYIASPPDFNVALAALDRMLDSGE